MKWFSDCKTIEALKRKYYALASKYHPDHGGDTEVMKEINSEFSEMSKILKNKHEKVNDNSTEKEYERKEDFNAEKFMDIIQKIIRFNGIKIEICGSWLWVSGNTYPYRENLKDIGFRYSSPKKAWYYAENLLYKTRGKKTLKQIRNEYGSYTINNEPYVALKG